MSDEGCARRTRFTGTKKPRLPFDFVLDIIIRDKSNQAIFEDFLSEVLKYLKFLSKEDQFLIEEVKDEYPPRDPGLRKGVDVFARDDKGGQFIIKICCYYNSNSFMDKAVHNVSNTITTITDNLKKGVDVIYKTRKTFYLNILYKSQMYRIKPLNCVSIATKIDKDSQYYRKDAPDDTRQFRRCSEVEEIEVFEKEPVIVVLNLDVFNENEVREPTDEWMYLIKTTEAKNTFQSFYVKKASKIIDRLSKGTRIWNDFYDWLSEDEKAVEYYFTNVVKDYRKEDQEKVAKEITKRLVARGSSVESVAVTTGFLLEEIESLSLN